MKRNGGGVKGGKMTGSGGTVSDWAEKRDGKLRSDVKKKLAFG